ncbi:MAG: Amylopullulanase precursor [Syntrophorhabdus sp. PtaU1.Bin153]|nr:MAG: Amylopullulanase precursor [Syntrophorhabdus sp. PtaU1.Bin153]
MRRYERGIDWRRKKSIMPGAPTMLKLAIVPKGFQLTWQLSPQDPGIVTGYEIVRSDVASGPFTRVATVDKGTSRYIDTMASPETIYYYKVRTVAGDIYSPYSNTVTGER